MFKWCRLVCVQFLYLLNKETEWKSWSLQKTWLEVDSAKRACPASDFRKVMQFTSEQSKMTALLSTRIIQLGQFPDFPGLWEVFLALGKEIRLTGFCQCYILSWRMNFPGPQLIPSISKTLKCKPRAILLFGTEPPGYQQLSPASWLQSTTAILSGYSCFPSTAVLMCLCITAFPTAPCVEQAALLSLSPVSP